MARLIGGSNPFSNILKYNIIWWAILWYHSKTSRPVSLVPHHMGLSERRVARISWIDMFDDFLSSPFILFILDHTCIYNWYFGWYFGRSQTPFLDRWSFLKFPVISSENCRATKVATPAALTPWQRLHRRPVNMLIFHRRVCLGFP